MRHGNTVGGVSGVARFCCSFFISFLQNRAVSTRRARPLKRLVRGAKPRSPQNSTVGPQPCDTCVLRGRARGGPPDFPGAPERPENQFAPRCFSAQILLRQQKSRTGSFFTRKKGRANDDRRAPRGHLPRAAKPAFRDAKWSPLRSGGGCEARFFTYSNYPLIIKCSI